MDLRVTLATWAVCMLAVAAQSSRQRDKYTTKFDFLNIEQILKNNRLLKSYYKCIVDIGPCTQEGLEFKRSIPDALETRCRKCNPQQKKNAKKIVEFVQKYKPDMWAGAVMKYDPSGRLTRDILTSDFFAV